LTERIFQEDMMAQARLASMSIDALLSLRDDIGSVLARRANELKDQLSRIGEHVSEGARRRFSAMRGRRVAPKYRNPRTGETWSGRGAMAGWLSRAIEAGASLKDFAIEKSTGKRSSSRKKKLRSNRRAANKRTGKKRSAKKKMARKKAAGRKSAKTRAAKTRAAENRAARAIVSRKTANRPAATQGTV
jgi:DNA-binding protein H-NS